MPLSINDFGLPSGIFVQFANDLLGDTFLRNSSGTVAFAASGANANVLASDAASDAASGDAQTVNLVVTVDATTVPGSYPITLVGYNGSNEKQHKVTVVVSGNAGTTSQIFLPLINR